MKISILSDLHLDFWITPGKTKIAGRFKGILDKILDDSPDVEVLLVAGDITHYPSQLPLLDIIAEMYNYKKVFCTTGNHELYLVSNKQRDKYKNSWEKHSDYIKYKTDVVEFLDGNIVEYNGVKFGGTMGWYDGAPTDFSPYARIPLQEWKDVMTDSRLIKGCGDFYDIYAKELPKLKSILECDVVLTHISPSNQNEAFQPQYVGESSNKFYSFKGEELVQQTSAKFWVYGHSHGTHRYTISGSNTECVMNALGYPSETHQLTRMIIEV